jgi:hypothetical protein
MNPWIHLTSLLSLTAVVSAAPRTKTCYLNPPTTITKLVTQTCPAPKTVYLDTAGNTVPAPTNPASYVTTLPAVTKVTQYVYPSSMTCNGGEVVTIGGYATTISAPTVLANCPCSTRTTVIAPGPVITLPAAFAPGASSGNAGGAVGGNANAGANAGGAVGTPITTVINTQVVYPSGFVGIGGETLTIGGTVTIVPGPTYISQCPCTQATVVTVTAPGVTQFIPVPITVGGATLTSTATVISGVTVTATPTSGAGAVADRIFGTTVDGVSFLIEEGINYDGTPLALPARKNKRQQTSVNLQVCLKTCADNVACAGTSLNTQSSTCLYFSAIFASSRRRDASIIFATVLNRVTPTGTSSLSSSTSTSATSTSGTSTSGTSTSGTSTTANGGTSTSGTSTSATSTSGTSTSGTATTSQTADPSSDPDAPTEQELIVRAAAPKPAGLTLREANRNNAGAVVRRGGVLRRSNAEPAAKHATRKVVIEL